MQHLRLQVLNREANTGYLTLSVTIKDGTTAAAEVMGNINKGFETLPPRLLVRALDLSFEHLQDIIQKGAELGVYVESSKASAYPKLSSEQARANSLGHTLSSEQARANRLMRQMTYKASHDAGKAAREKLAKHGNRVICPECGDMVALAPGASIKQHRHGRNGKTGELNSSCVKYLAELARTEVVKL
jgi:hypothetical protein